MVASKFGKRAALVSALGLLTACNGTETDETAEAAPVCIEPITVAAVGDFLLHGPIQRFAAAQENGTQAIMEPVKDLISAADLAIVNLEGAAAKDMVGLSGRTIPTPAGTYDGRAYSSYPMFNYHPSVIGDLKAVGFDLIQTANNHSADRGGPGVDGTIASIQAEDLPFTGTRLADAKKEGFDWSARYTVKRRKQTFQFAAISCTFSTNGLPDPDDQVLMCYEDREEVLGQIKALAGDEDIDAVIVLPHWGIEYQPRPARQEVELAQDMADAGATAIIGTHPHVVQPKEILETKDGRTVPVVYSLGNFVSRQIGLPRLATVIYLLGFTPNADGKLDATLTGWIPARMDTGPNKSIDALDRLPEGAAAPYAAHLLKTFDPKNKIAADPAKFWNNAHKPVCAPKPDPAPKS